MKIPYAIALPQGGREQTEYVARLWIQFSNSDRRSQTRVRPRDAMRPRRCLALPPGRQDHTTSPYAATSFVSSLCNRSQAEARPAIHRAQNAAASTASLPAFVTIMIRPSFGVGHE